MKMTLGVILVLFRFLVQITKELFLFAKVFILFSLLVVFLSLFIYGLHLLEYYYF
jgi:hypothetical protein